VAPAAHLVGLGEPGLQLGVDVLGTAQAELVHVVVGRDVLDPAESRAADRPREDEVGVEMVTARTLDRREAAVDLERDARLRGIERDVALLARGGHERVEGGPQRRCGGREELVDRAHVAGVRHVARDEALAAPRAAPQRGLAHRPGV